MAEQIAPVLTADEWARVEYEYHANVGGRDVTHPAVIIALAYAELPDGSPIKIGVAELVVLSAVAELLAQGGYFTAASQISAVVEKVRAVLPPE